MHLYMSRALCPNRPHLGATSPLGPRGPIWGARGSPWGPWERMGPWGAMRTIGPMCPIGTRGPRWQLHPAAPRPLSPAQRPHDPTAFPGPQFNCNSCLGSVIATLRAGTGFFEIRENCAIWIVALFCFGVRFRKCVLPRGLTNELPNCWKYKKTSNPLFH